ncbi:hypothetical protein D3C87_1650930 [compost metagenome]
MDDAVHIGSRAVNPRMKTVGRVGHAAALLHAQVLVHHEQIASRDLVKAQAQALRVIAPRFRRARGDLPGQARVVPAIEQNAARQRQPFTQAPLRRVELALHLGLRPRDQFVFSQVHRIVHHVSVMPCSTTA